MSRGKLFFFCGKMGAGKSTHAKLIAAENNAVLLSEDAWLAALYPNAISNLQDYVHYSDLLKAPIKQLVHSILSTGTNVVMDFPANTPAQREWFRAIYSEVGADHSLVFLDVPDALCLAQIAQRRQEQPERAATDTAEMFDAVTKYFVAPTVEEGFAIELITRKV